MNETLQVSATSDPVFVVGMVLFAGGMLAVFAIVAAILASLIQENRRAPQERSDDRRGEVD